MKVNGITVRGKTFAYDGIGKIYICEDSDEEEMMRGFGLEILPISKLEETYNNSCSERFIDSARFNVLYAEDTAVFE